MSQTILRSSTRSTSITKPQKHTRNLPARASKLQSNGPKRPDRDPFIDVLSDHLLKMKTYSTWREMASDTWVSPSTLSRYARRRGRYIRSDTLRGILRIFGLELKIR